MWFSCSVSWQLNPQFFVEIMFNSIQTHIISLNILYYMSTYHIHLVINLVCMRSECFLNRVVLDFVGKDWVRPSDCVCREEAFSWDGHQGEEPLKRPVFGSPPWFQAAPAGHHGWGTPPTHRHELQRVCWIPDRTSQQGTDSLSGAELHYRVCLKWTMSQFTFGG